MGNSPSKQRPQFTHYQKWNNHRKFGRFLVYIVYFVWKMKKVENIQKKMWCACKAHVNWSHIGNMNIWNALNLFSNEICLPKLKFQLLIVGICMGGTSRMSSFKILHFWYKLLHKSAVRFVLRWNLFNKTYIFTFWEGICMGDTLWTQIFKNLSYRSFSMPNRQTKLQSDLFYGVIC
jgi:hypothetical protein